ncbi:unnamed protein product [Prunus armeniaca]
MRDDETLPVYLTSLLELVNQMKGYEEELPRARLVHKLLISLTKEFDLVCYVIKQTKDIETIEVQEVIAALRGFAQLLDRHAESTTERAFSSMNVNPKGTQSNPNKNWKSKGKRWDPKPPNSVNQGGKNDQERKFDQAKGKCKHCDKLHYGDCWFKGKPKCHGCNRFGHFIKDCDQPNKAGKLVNFANQCRVKMGTRDLVQSIGKGQMVEHGYWLVFSYYMVDIYGDRQMEDMIASIPMKGNKCFPLGLEYVNPLMANKATVEESSWVWHRRYGHLNYIRKGHREPFDKEKAWRASQAL